MFPGAQAALKFLAVWHLEAGQKRFAEMIEKSARIELLPLSAEGVRRGQVQHKMEGKVRGPGSLAAIGKQLEALAEQAMEERQSAARNCKLVEESHARDRCAVPCTQRVGVNGGTSHVGALQQREIVHLADVLFCLGKHGAAVGLIQQRLEIVPA